MGPPRDRFGGGEVDLNAGDRGVAGAGFYLVAKVTSGGLFCFDGAAWRVASAWAAMAAEVPGPVGAAWQERRRIAQEQTGRGVELPVPGVRRRWN